MRALAIIGSVVTLAILLVPDAPARTAAPAEAAGQAPSTLTIRSTRFGRILFDSRGRALYAFTRDPRGQTTCFGNCARAWPPYLVTGGVRAGSGIDAAKLGTIRRRGGGVQVTYAGRPLYYYVGDRRPGQVSCQNVFEYGGLWLVQRPNGTLVR